MRILVMAAGSRGDVVPYVGVGARLRAAGHEVALATHAPYAGAATAAGLAFRPLPADPRAASGATPRGTAGREEATRGAGGEGGVPSRGRAGLLRAASAFVGRLGPGMVEAARPGADLLLLSTTTAPLGWHLAEALDVDSMGLYLQPVAPTGAFPPVVGGTRSLGRWGNQAAGRLALRVVDRVHADAARALRHRLGLPPAGSRAARRAREAAGWPVLHGFSPALVPRPADWRPGLQVTGNWWPHLPADAALPAELADFLQAGPPPVFVGFGSMGGGHGERLGELVARALRAARVRGVVQSGWAGLAAHGDDVLTIGEVPHALLFPHLAAVVQHAGAGTAAAAVRAGVPSVPVPVLADQPFWARRLAASGAATPPIPFAALTADRLAASITRAVGEPELGVGARRLARRLATEDGAGAVVRAVAALPVAGG
ncbi:nucleotide disphospho-sugar-binding domain-containing protein [Streptomyces sp. NPDC057702]|uniref:nucleotide disphospho-sugar-binding domain-containing protein n=1 Tax=unclassified Streptomyces TaxID=2593676 RepID=UPI0036CBE823